MTLETRIKAFAALGKEIEGLIASGQESTASKAYYENPWFTPDNVALALKGIAAFLTEDALREWTAKYPAEPAHVKSIGVAMAGNIPMVGFHDALCVLISGHRLRAKLSSQDTVLMKELLHRLVVIEPRFEQAVSVEERLNDADAMIATGGNNTARYFEYYFRHVPHIIRRNRTSCAILTGKESETEFESLGKDVFSYFGLGCRNVSKLYLPETFDFIPLLACWEKNTAVVNHHKYANNYTYQRGIMLMNQISFYDNGAVILKQENAMVSPIAVVYYEFYSSSADLNEKLQVNRDQLQCTVSSGAWYPQSLAFGTTQSPKLDDYADGVDTMRFLEGVATGRAALQANP